MRKKIAAECTNCSAIGAAPSPLTAIWAAQKSRSENSFDYFADVLEVDGRIVGFEFGERLASNNGIVHIEKGDINYDGVYPMLCHAFAAKHFKDVSFINRQEDMGLDGLRKSKLSYHPCGFVEKRIVVLKV